jgi:hypothetical protein
MKIFDPMMDFVFKAMFGCRQLRKLQSTDFKKFQRMKE